jgi:hypothetical protein
MPGGYVVTAEQTGFRPAPQPTILAVDRRGGSTHAARRWAGGQCHRDGARLTLEVDTATAGYRLGYASISSPAGRNITSLVTLVPAPSRGSLADSPTM